jgi:hypothetical protein
MTLLLVDVRICRLRRCVPKEALAKNPVVESWLQIRQAQRLMSRQLKAVGASVRRTTRKGSRNCHLESPLHCCRRLSSLGDLKLDFRVLLSRASLKKERAVIGGPPAASLGRDLEAVGKCVIRFRARETFLERKSHDSAWHPFLALPPPPDC